MTQGTYDNPLVAALVGAFQRTKKNGPRVALHPGDRLDGCTCLITGANKGLGKATAIALLRRGARVLMACRSDIPQAGEEVRRESGSDAVEMLQVDLSDLGSVQLLCDELLRRGTRLDVLVVNAAVMPARSRRTRQGFELMFGVNYLAHYLLVRRLLRDGVLPNRTFAGQALSGRRPRIVIISSEAHRDAPPIDLAHLGVPAEYGVMTGMPHYGRSKLLLTSFAIELSRRLRGPDGIDVAVHALCPGAVNSSLAREAPVWLKPVLFPVMRLFFSSPEQAAGPVVYLACAGALAGQTGTYLHLGIEKEPSAAACDPDMGARLWQATEALLQKTGVFPS